MTLRTGIHPIHTHTHTRIRMAACVTYVRPRAPLAHDAVNGARQVRARNSFDLGRARATASVGSLNHVTLTEHPATTALSGALAEGLATLGRGILHAVHHHPAHVMLSDIYPGTDTSCTCTQHVPSCSQPSPTDWAGWCWSPADHRRRKEILIDRTPTVSKQSARSRRGKAWCCTWLPRPANHSRVEWRCPPPPGCSGVVPSHRHRKSESTRSTGPCSNINFSRGCV